MVRYKADPGISLERSEEIARAAGRRNPQGPRRGVHLHDRRRHTGQAVNEGSIYVKLDAAAQPGATTSPSWPTCANA